MSGQMRPPLSLAERAARAAKHMQREERQVSRQPQQQQGMQVVLMAEVNLTFHPSVHEIFGSTKSYRNAGCLGDGEFLRIISPEFQHVYPREVVVMAEMIPSRIQQAAAVPEQA